MEKEIIKHLEFLKSQLKYDTVAEQSAYVSAVGAYPHCNNSC